MEGSHKGQPVSGGLGRSLLFEDIGSKERTNFVNGLCDFSSAVTPRCEMFLEISGM